jgi:hypothetical protein
VTGDAPYAYKEPLSSYAAAGVTWWLETIMGWRGTFEDVRAYVRDGPPK